jgi:ubiquinone/menaquinone biosynthesis C-methylase UbiE
MNDHFINIYKHHADTYQEMIEFEDVDGNLPRLLEEITSFTGKTILDLGSGTGRIPQLFPQVGITCLDLQLGMLRESQRQCEIIGGRWFPLQGDGRWLPFPNSTFEVITAGWAFGHFAGWYPQTWQREIDKMLSEAERALKPGSPIIIIETLTTGAVEPAPPHEGLAAYYHYLENRHAFTRETIQTDYLFNDLEQAGYYAGFFFGPELAGKVKANNWVRLPEWTGVWHKRV